MNALLPFRHAARLAVALALPLLTGCVIYDDGYYGYDGYDVPAVHVHSPPVVVRHYHHGYHGPRYHYRGRVHRHHYHGPRFGYRHRPPHRHYHHH